MCSSSLSKTFDVLIIGGAIAGLAGALSLAQQQHTTVVLDSHVYRNDLSSHMHNVLTWDREDPNSFRAAAAKNILDGYSTIAFESEEIASIMEIGGIEGGTLFTATSVDGRTYRGRKVIQATGVKDIYPDIDGYAQCFATAIYHCFFCKGYEARGVESAGLLTLPDLASAPIALHIARQALRFAKSVTIYTHGNAELEKRIHEAQGSNQVFKVDNRKIFRFEKGPNFSDIIIHFESGDSVIEGFIGHKPSTEPKGDFHKQLGLEMTPMGDPVIKPMFCETTRKGVFVGGDGASPMKIIPQALFTGSAAAAAAAAQLQAEDATQTCIF